MITLDHCRSLDRDDALGTLVGKFAPGAANTIYLDANSLGAMPKTVPDAVGRLLQHGWVEQRRRGWSELDWVDLPRQLGDGLGSVVGTRPGDLVVCDSTTINLYKLLAFGARIAAPRRVIVAERHVFPTDLYVAEGVVQQSRGALELRLIDRPEDLFQAIDRDVAVVCLSYVDYRSSRRWDMAQVNRAAREAGALTLWDLSHGAGAVGIDLNGSGADLATGCGYKYLSGGPGAPALLYVAERHRQAGWPTIPGWFGHADPFAFHAEYAPHPGVERHLSGSPAVLASVAFRAMTEIWQGVAATALDAKHRSLSALAIGLVDEWCAPFGVTVASPRRHDEQGGHVALRHPEAGAIVQALLVEGVVCSFRKPDSIRLGIGPLALRHEDVWIALSRLRALLESGTWKKALGGKPPV